MKSARIALVLPLLFLTACAQERASGPITQDVYVWQRDWNPEVRQAVQQTSGFGTLVVLAAEADLREEIPKVARIPLDAEALKASGRKIGAAVRVSSFPGSFGTSPRRAETVRRLVRETVAEARAKGIALSEIQIDYDSPETKLVDYRNLVASLQQDAGEVPLVLTTLPTWIGRRQDFRELVRAADGFVLQVHSVSQPSGKGGEIVLCDPEITTWWIEEVARFRRPFRVALPTYAYATFFDAQGKLVGLAAEGTFFSGSDGTRVRFARSDPKAMAGLVRGWTRERPVELTGIIWYRLPVGGDRLNWSRAALEAVIQGREPSVAVKAEVRQPEPGLVEIDLVSSGEADAPWPAAVQVRWKGEAPLAVDGLATYQSTKADAGQLRFQRSGAGSLRPGERRTIGWLRFADPTEVSVELPQNPG